MFEFALVNFCVFNYTNQKNLIDSYIKDIKDSLKKQKVNIQMKL